MYVGDGCIEIYVLSSFVSPVISLLSSFSFAFFTTGGLWFLLLTFFTMFFCFNMCTWITYFTFVAGNAIRY